MASLTDDEMDTLELCPFCGDKPHTIENIDNQWQVHCTWCGARGPIAGLRNSALRIWNNSKFIYPPKIK